MSYSQFKTSIILKDVNETCVYAVDLEDDSNSFVKFEGPAYYFVHGIYEKKTLHEIFQSVQENYEVDESQLQKDFDFTVQEMVRLKLVTA
jgi:hypothetical protein